MSSNNRTILIVLALLAGLWLYAEHESQRDYPILRAVVRLAKVAGWVLLAETEATPPHAVPPDSYTGGVTGEPNTLATGPVRELDAVGEPVIDHGAGW